jgi:hypothetical protein
MSIVGGVLTLEDENATLLEPQNVSWEEAREVWEHGAALEQLAHFYMGYAASCVLVSYGEESLRQFAWEVGASYSSVAQKRRVYGRLMQVAEDTRLQFLRAIKSGVLSFSHLLVANSLGEGVYEEKLLEAHDAGWSKRRLAEEVAITKGSIPAWDADKGDVAPTLPDEPGSVPCPHCKGTGLIGTV